MPQVIVPALFGGLTALFSGGGLGAIAAQIAIGAAVGGLGMAMNRAKGRDARDREVNDVLQSKSQRNLPLPVIFGRGRTACNYLVVGNFFETESISDAVERAWILNAVVGIGEGKIRATGAWTVNGMTVDGELAEQLQLKGDEDEKQAKRQRFLYLSSLAGHASQDLEAAFGEFYDYKLENQPSFSLSNRNRMPYRNTAVGRVRCFCGTNGPAFLDIGVDVLGPDYTLRRTIGLSDTTSGISPAAVLYDGHSESWYCTTSTSSISEPWGVFKYSRWGGLQEHTPPPENETASISRAWYLGRHDVLVMQSPGSDSTFHVGSWGLSRDSAGWNTYQPDPNYQHAMILDHLDELHGILHSFHWDDDLEVHFIMRWNLLTGSIERIDTDLGPGSYRHLVFSPDINAYVVVSEDRIHLLSPVTGRQMDSRPKDNENSLGAFVSGRMIGVIFSDRVRLWDYLDNENIEYESEGMSVTSTEDDGTPKPYFGSATCAAQNTYTGHVALGCVEGGQYAVVNFLASVEIPPEENTFIANPDVENETDASMLLGRKWVRDWSYRKPGGIKLRMLEGESSVAASMYAALFREDSYNSSRWGSGIDPKFACLSSFESLHARCVTPERYLRSNSARWENGGQMRKAYEFEMAACGDAPPTVERFEPDDSLEFVWHSAEGGRLWLNEPGGAGLYEYLGEKRDNRYILKTKTMIDAGRGAYMKGPRNNSRSPSTRPAEWDPGKNAYCYQNGRTIKHMAVKAVRVLPRAEDDEQSPEQDGERILLEKYQCDYVWDAQTSVANLVDDVMLASCNGYRCVIDGKLNVGIAVPGRLPMFNVTDDLREGSGQLVLSAGQRPNSITLQYANRFDDWRADFAQASFDFGAEVEGQVIGESPTNPGISRPGQANQIANLMLTTTASHRRQYSATIKFTGLVLSPGDCVAIWDRENGLDGDLFIINSWSEEDENRIKLTATEHVPLVPGIRAADAGDAPPSGTGGNPPLLPGRCERVRVSVGTDTVWFNNGAQYPAGKYMAKYVRDAVMLTPSSGYVVDGYRITTSVDGNIVTIVPAPAVADPAEGYPTVAAAKAANAGQTAKFELLSPGPIGIRASTSTRHANPDGSTIYELCLDGVADFPNPTDPTDPGDPPPPPPAPTTCGGAVSTNHVYNVVGSTSDGTPVTFSCVYDAEVGYWIGLSGTDIYYPFGRCHLTCNEGVLYIRLGMQWTGLCGFLTIAWEGTVPVGGGSTTLVGTGGSGFCGEPPSSTIAVTVT